MLTGADREPARPLHFCFSSVCLAQAKIQPLTYTYSTLLWGYSKTYKAQTFSTFDKQFSSLCFWWNFAQQLVQKLLWKLFCCLPLRYCALPGCHLPHGFSLLMSCCTQGIWDVLFTFVFMMTVQLERNGVHMYTRSWKWAMAGFDKHKSQCQQ